MVLCLDRGKIMKKKYFIEYNLQLFAKDGPGGEKTEEATIEIATLIYNNIEYKVNKVAFEKWLSENTIIE